MIKDNTNTKSLLFPINIIGISASGVIDLSSKLQEIILSAEKIAAPKRIIPSFITWWNSQNTKKSLPEIFSIEKTQELIQWLNTQQRKTVVLASGDPLWFGIGRILLDHFSSKQLRFHPSPTSLQIAFSRLGRPWQDTEWISIHGREVSPLASLLQKNPSTIGILTDPKRGGAIEVKELLRSLQLENQYGFWVFENLGHEKESIYKVNPKEEIPELAPLHLVILIREKEKLDLKKELPLFGIKDNCYLSHADRPGLMTKREIRIQILADLELPEEGVIWDVGAGVGSIGLEALRIRPKLQLLSIEKRVGGAELINKNAKRLTVKPSKILEGEALEIIEKKEMPKNLLNPSRVILGGGSSRKANLLQAIINSLKPKGIVVIPIATLESMEKMLNLLKHENCNLNISQHINFKGVPLKKGTRLHPLNPIFIIKAQLK